LSAVGEELLGQLAGALGGAADLIDIGALRRGQRLILEEQVRVAEHHEEQVVEVVRDAARERADRLQLERVTQLLLGLAQRLVGADPLGDIAREHHPRLAALPLREVERADLHADLGPIFFQVAPAPRGAREVRVGDGMADEVRILGRPDVEDGHREKLLARVAVVRQRRGVDLDEAQRGPLVDPDRQRRAIEEQPIPLF